MMRGDEKNRELQLSNELELSAQTTLGLYAGRVMAWARRERLLWRLVVQDLGPSLRRAIDVVLAGMALVLALPVLAVAALAVKLTSRGPVFYRQERIGKNGRAFSLLKFRTMVQNAEALKTALAAANPEAMNGVRFKLRRDPRLTPVGPVLRKFSIDELPQLLNVLRGDMTLVGPRPPVRREVVEYDIKALRRLEVVPGLTCLWQIRGRSELSFEQQVALDVEYIDTVRPSAEVGIVLRTVPAVLSGRGAY
jgi:lipopolysaccharide/colanic/teichoic acid biosynthesis glycosyltransferase